MTYLGNLPLDLQAKLCSFIKVKFYTHCEKINCKCNINKNYILNVILGKDMSRYIKILYINARHVHRRRIEINWEKLSNMYPNLEEINIDTSYLISTKNMNFPKLNFITLRFKYQIKGIKIMKELYEEHAKNVKILGN